MGEYRGRCCICEKPQQLLDEEDEPILCFECNKKEENRKIFEDLLKTKEPSPNNKDVERWNNLMRFKNARVSNL